VFWLGLICCVSVCGFFVIGFLGAVLEMLEEESDDE